MSGLISGAGLYIYRLGNIKDLSGLISWAADLGFRWIAPRVVGWAWIDSKNEPYMDNLKALCDEHGLSLGGWGYHVILDGQNKPPHASDTGDYEPEAARRAINRWALEFYVVDAEKECKVGTIPYSGWLPRPDQALRNRAEIFWETLRGYEPDLPLGMTSYRYPTYHREFIWDQMADPKFVDFLQPQVYWQGDSRTAAGSIQLEATVKSHQSMGINLPMVPICPSYSAGTWHPTGEQEVGFTKDAQAQGMSGWGIYAADFLTAAQREALAGAWYPGGAITPPPVTNPQSGPPDDALARLWTYAQAHGWDV